jgi:hypothetical protein
MKYANFIFSTVFLFINITGIVAQDAKLVNRQVIGTWVYAKDSGDKYIFSLNGNCVCNLGPALLLKYKYSITNDPADCDPGIRKKEGDTTAYIRLYDIEEKSIECYVINGLSNKILSIRRFGEGGSRLYLRQKKKQPRY